LLQFAGVHEWIGRVQAVILFAVSLPFFFLLVREIFGAWQQSYPEFAEHLTNNATLIEATPEFRIYKLDTPAR
jgi:hypothetical protein